MKDAGTYSQNLAHLLQEICEVHRAEPPTPQDPVTQLIAGFLQWNAPRRSAVAALGRICRAMVDHNELRVSHEHEIVALLGSNYPYAQERSARMREALQETFVREYAVSLDSLAERSKRDVRAYLASLPGITPYVTAYVTLVSFKGHAVPVDDRLAELLRSENVVGPNATLEQITSFLEHHIRANTTLQMHASLQDWVDAGSQRVSLRCETRGTAASGRTLTNATRTKSRRSRTKNPAK